MTHASKQPGHDAPSGVHSTPARKRIPSSSQATEALYRSLLAAVLDPTIAIDQHGTVVTASASVEKVFGWKPDELLGRNIKVLMPEPHHTQHDEYLANYRRTGATNILNRTREFVVVHKSGAQLLCELSVARVDLPDVAEPLFIGAFRDVTRRREAEMKLEASERRFRAIFDRSYPFMGLLSPDGTMREVNQSALELVGVERSSVIGVKMWDTPWWSASPAERERARSAIAEAAEGKFVRFETVHPDRDGELVAIDFSLNPVRDAEGRVVLLIPEGRNISELKRAQRAETSMLRALATIGESAAMLAHEIKNPITAVNVALRAVATQLGEDEKAVLEDLVVRMQRLEALMRRTLSFAKPIDLHINTFEVRDLVEAVVKGLRPEIVKRGAEVRTQIEGGTFTLHADRQLLDEVLTNLLKNALEAKPQGAKVLISARRDAWGITFIVEDDGPGIPESIRNSLFKPFSTTKPKGTGLGLAFCRKVADEHGGTIEAGVASLGGARFEIHLPATHRSSP